MDRRVAPVRRASFIVLALALVACGPWQGWWTIVPLLLVGGIFALADSRLATLKRPEYAMFGAWAASAVIISVSVVITGGPKVPELSWLAIPIVTLSARFSQRGIILGVVFTLVLLCIVGFVFDPSAVIDDPPILIAPAALIVAVAILSTALMRSDLQHRTEAVIDQLTGMLNRNALSARVNELTQQAVISGQPIGMIVGDLDEFKEVNDSAGHVAGDAVLRDVAKILRNELRAFDLAYRIGGEEFLILVPGADAGEAFELAETLRTAVGAATLGEAHRITMSFGVSASAPDEAFDYSATFGEADGALYEAKRAGRNRVVAHGGWRRSPDIPGVGAIDPTV